MLTLRPLAPGEYAEARDPASEFDDFGPPGGQGITRGAQWRHGAWHDGHTYSVLRAELSG